jgi:hypothetical protein
MPAFGEQVRGITSQPDAIVMPNLGNEDSA